MREGLWDGRQYFEPKRHPEPYGGTNDAALSVRKPLRYDDS
jgi:hypothetical protein